MQDEVYGKEKWKMRMCVCDRCGEKILGRSGRISIFGAKEIEKEYRGSLQGKDFCRECIAEIVKFASNKNTCDECIREMEENAVLLSKADDEKRRSSNQEEPDPDEINWSGALKRMEQSDLTAGSQC